VQCQPAAGSSFVSSPRRHRILDDGAASTNGCDLRREQSTATAQNGGLGISLSTTTTRTGSTPRWQPASYLPSGQLRSSASTSCRTPVRHPRRRPVTQLMEILAARFAGISALSAERSFRLAGTVSDPHHQATFRATPLLISTDSGSDARCARPAAGRQYGVDVDEESGRV
jgi:hypothetical protein